jgi:acyl-CoA synthetase (NDP forming)
MADLAPSRWADAIDAVRRRGDTVIVEPEGYPLLAHYGIPCPRCVVVAGEDEVTEDALEEVAGERVVVKIASPQILHRSDVGGVAVVEKRSQSVRRALRDLAARLDPHGRARFTVNEFVPYEREPGRELLLGLRWTDDFGAVVVVAPGGIHAEFWGRALSPELAVAMFPVEGMDRAAVSERLRRLPLVRLVTESQRGQPPVCHVEAIADAVAGLQAIGRHHVPQELREIEINPLAISARGPVALDVLARVGTAVPAPWPARPLHRLPALYQPRCVAVAGVSEKSINVGRIILRNLLRDGFPADRILVLKPGADHVDGCRCVPSVAAIPERVDLLVLAIGAAQVPAALTEIVEHQAADSVIVIPGGLEEKSGTADLVSAMRESLLASRRTPWGGPLVNGGNCLGIRSRPGRYDTLFIPGVKLPVPDAPEAPLAFISQSGAFAIARASRLATLNPRYLVTTGNQMDLTVADHLEALSADEHVRVFALYVEGFKPLDGHRVVQTARRLAAEGRRVVLYRAGRTAAGAQASASHTAAIAGDYAVTREMARSAGILLAESIDTFEDLVQICTALSGRVPGRGRIGAVSNAGFECVAFADSLGGCSLASLGRETASRLTALFRSARIEGLVDVHNPLDVTPMADDEAFAAAVETLASDEAVDIVIAGCVPLTAQLNTLAPGAGHVEDATRADAVGPRLARVFHGMRKPMVVVIDSGALYDRLTDGLSRAGVPVFRSADRALNALNAWALAAGS